MRYVLLIVFGALTAIGVCGPRFWHMMWPQIASLATGIRWIFNRDPEDYRMCSRFPTSYHKEKR